jgi:predicted RND superfamily exporter protein
MSTTQGQRREPGPVCRRLVPWLVRRRALVLALAALATLAGAFFSVLLYGDLRANVEELLPKDAPSVIAAKTIGPKLHSVTHLSVILEGGDPDVMDRFADDLAARLRALPPALVTSVEYRTDAQEAFLRRFGPLYLSIDDLETIQRRIDARVDWEKRNANSLLNLLGDEAEPAPPLDFEDIEKKYEGTTGALANFRKGYFQTPDGSLLVLLVRPPRAIAGISVNQSLFDAVKAEVGRLDPARYDRRMKVGYDGDVATLVEEQEALVADLASSTAVVVVLVLLVLWLFFRRWAAILSISGSLAVGCAVTFGLSYFLIGHLNANTAFLGSIVIGNGINVSIILAARYLEERRKGVDFDRAIQIAWSGTIAATFVASFGAGVAYLSLASTQFRGFSQFGVIGGLGMTLCWVGAYLLMPPLLSLLDRKPIEYMTSRQASIFGRVVARFVTRNSTVLRLASIVLLLAAGVGVATYRGRLIEYDLSKLRAAKSAREGAVFWGEKVDKVFRAYLTPIVIRAASPADLDRTLAAVEEERRALGKSDPLREVRTIESVLPRDQEAKLPLIDRLRESLTDARIEMLAPALREKVRRLRPAADLKPARLEDLPETFRLPLTERDGSAGRIALAYPAALGPLTPRDLEEITRIIRSAIARSGADAQAVGQSLLFADIASTILRDGPKATALALGAVCLLVLLVFRRAKPVVVVIGSLLLGVSWLVGLAAAFRVRLNFLNFVVLPITFGIGVDYAVNIMQRRRIEGPGSLKHVLRETGGAVALCSATTIIGYASLLAADNRALKGFGLLASIGEVVCLAAALFVLPAWIMRGDKSEVA